MVATCSNLNHELLCLSQVTETRGVSGHTVGDFVKTGGENYKLFSDNCIHSANRMTKLGKK